MESRARAKRQRAALREKQAKVVPPTRLRAHFVFSRFESSSIVTFLLVAGRFLTDKELGLQIAY